MANCITRHIPNAVTCCNLFSGCIASVMAFNENYTLAISFIILGAVFDFFDGMLARLFKVSGPLGKELDSLADDITFGFAPSAIVFSLFKEVHQQIVEVILPAFIHSFTPPEMIKHRQIYEGKCHQSTEVNQCCRGD